MCISAMPTCNAFVLCNFSVQECIDVGGWLVKLMVLLFEVHNVCFVRKQMFYIIGVCI